MSESSIEEREATDLEKTHADYFRIAPAGEYAAILFGELNTEIQDNGEVQPTEVVYDTKVKMSVESLRSLRDLIDDVVVDEEPEGENAQFGRGVQ